MKENLARLLLEVQTRGEVPWAGGRGQASTKKIKIDNMVLLTSRPVIDMEPRDLVASGKLILYNFNQNYGWDGKSNGRFAMQIDSEVSLPRN